VSYVHMYITGEANNVWKQYWREIWKGKWAFVEEWKFLLVIPWILLKILFAAPGFDSTEEMNAK